MSRPAFLSLAILTFITFVGNFTQLQLSAALPTLVSDFHISVTLGQWMTSIFQLTMGVMVPLTAYLTRRFSTRQIVITSMVVFTLGSVLSWLSPSFPQLQLSAALPTWVSDFHISVTLGQWMTSIFQLTMGVMVPLTAYLTRRFSTRQIVITSMVVFTLGSVLAWLSPSFPLALFGRFLEAVGTGVMWPVLQITVFSIFPLARRGMAMGIVGMAMAVAPAIGPTLGGVQTDLNGWRSIFLTLTVIGCLAIVLTTFGLHNFGQADKSAHADFFSVGLSIVGFGGLMFGFTNIQAYPFSAPVVWLPMVIGLAGIIWFVLRQFHTEKMFKAGKSSRPALLDLSVLRNRSFSIGTIIASLSFFAFSSLIVLIPLFIQDCRGYSAKHSGLPVLRSGGLAAHGHWPGRHHLVRAAPVPHREDVQGRQEQPPCPA